MLPRFNCRNTFSEARVAWLSSIVIDDMVMRALNRRFILRPNFGRGPDLYFKV